MQTQHNPFAAESLPWRAAFVEEKRTVFWGFEDGGNQAPLSGFAKIKVKNTAGAVIEANKAHNTEPGTWKTAEVQTCYFATVNANTNEEAAKVVNEIINGNVDPIANSEIAGPKLAGNVNGKYAVVVSSSLEEVTPQP